MYSKAFALALLFSGINAFAQVPAPQTDAFAKAFDFYTECRAIKEKTAVLVAKIDELAKKEKGLFLERRRNEAKKDLQAERSRATQTEAYKFIAKSASPGRAASFAHACAGSAPLWEVLGQFPEVPRFGDLKNYLHNNNLWGKSQYELRSDIAAKILALRYEEQTLYLTDKARRLEVKELRIEKTYFVTLYMRKHSYDAENLDDAVGKWAMNNLTAVTKTVVVGEQTYNQWKVGQTISSKWDGLGYLLNDEVSRYSVKVSGKNLEEQHFALVDGKYVELDGYLHGSAKSRIMNEGIAFAEAYYAGLATFTILPKPLSQLEVISKRPLKRYYAKVEVRNTSFTFDLSKHARNALLAHDFEIEIPEAQYGNKRLWDATPNWGTLVWKGNFSSMKGRILSVREYTDSQHSVITTKDGQSFVVKN